MKKIISFILAVVLCIGISACGNNETVTVTPEEKPIITEEKPIATDERPMTTEEIFEFAQTYGNIHSFEYTRFISTEYDYSSFVKFLKSLPELEKDICHSAIEGDNLPPALQDSPWEIYWRDADDVMDVWYKYVDKDSKISTKADGYYSPEENRYYFNDNLYGDRLEPKDGYIKGNFATIYDKYLQINFKFSNGKWKLYSYSKTGANPPVMCDRMGRLTGDELENIRQQTNITSELFDGYKDENFYILYSEHRMYYLKYENGVYTKIAESQLNWNREKIASENIYVAEGKCTEMQYTVNPQWLPKDETKGAKYNETVDAYSSFLALKAESILEFLNEDNSQSSLYTSYLKDLNDDGIPEMISYMEPMWPYSVFTYRNGEVVELPGAFSNGQHGSCGLLENGMYRSQHHSTGWTDTFVTYNKNGSQTIENFSEYYTYGYEKYTVKADGTQTDKYSIEFEKDEDGKRKFYALYSPYKEALEHFYHPEQWYSPFVADTTLNYSPYIMQQIKK